jgi:hypothetical protein
MFVYCLLLSSTPERFPVSLALFVDVDLLEHYFVWGRLDAGDGKIFAYGDEEGH